TGPAAPSADRYDRCLALATTNPAAAEAEAGQWALAGGDFLASQCLGMAYSREQRWSAAAAAFEKAATGAERAKDKQAVNY
ncbi:hypothetical protein JND48_15120, partial [Listeria monocytogenes]|nr:hypothetical protein [Listeria monocytogenes]